MSEDLFGEIVERESESNVSSNFKADSPIESSTVEVLDTQSVEENCPTAMAKKRRKRGSRYSCTNVIGKKAKSVKKSDKDLVRYVLFLFSCKGHFCKGIIREFKNLILVRTLNYKISS